MPLPPLYLLPGVGADHRLFDAQRAARDLHVISWIEPEHRREPLAHYAQRMANGLRIDERFDLGGASFGGILALELARHLSPQRLFLLGSCRSPSAIAPSLRALRVLEPLIPDRLLHPPRITARWFGARTEAHIDLFDDMLAATPPAFIRWASNAILSWDGVANLPVPVHHIHGARDRIIPARRARADRVIAGAGHLLTITHADAVNEFIASAI